MGLGEQFGVGIDGVGTEEFDESDESDRSAPSATADCGKIDADTPPRARITIEDPKPLKALLVKAPTH